MDLQGTAAMRKEQSNGVRTWRRSPLLVSLLLVAGLGLIYLLIWLANPAMTAGNNGNDLIFLADGARRLAGGQLLHRDFAVPVGALPYLLYWGGETLLPGIPPFIAMHLFMYVLIAPLLIAGAARLRNWWLRLGLVGAVAVMALLPFNTAGPGFCGTDFYASYNDFGAALSLAYIAWLFRAGDRPRTDASLLAWAMLLAFFLKIVYLAVIFAPLAVLVVLDRRWRRVAVMSLCLVAIVLIAIQLTTGLVGAYLGNIRAMAAVNKGKAVYFLFSFVYKHIVPVLLASVVTLGLLVVLLRKKPVPGGVWGTLVACRDPLVMAAAMAGIIVAESQSTGGMGFSAGLGLLAAPSLQAPLRNEIVAFAIALAAVIVGTLASNAFEKGTCNLLQRDGPGVTPAWATRFVPQIKVPQRVAQAAVSLASLWEASPEALRKDEGPLLTFPDDVESIRYLAQWVTVDHAIEVLKAKGTMPALGRVTSLSFADMFGYALDAQPAKGVENVIDIGRSMALPDPEGATVYLRGVDTVFVPTCRLDETAPAGTPPLWTSFAVPLSRNFEPTKLTSCWTMYRRKAE